MAAIESGLSHAGDRDLTAARWLRGFMVLGAVVVALGVVHYAIATVYDFDDPNEGNPWDLLAWEWAFVATPIWLPLTVTILLIAAGAKWLAPLRSGSARTRLKVNTLAWVTALATGVYAGYSFTMFGVAESGFGPRNHSLGVFFEDLANGSLNPVGWMGIAAFVGLIALFFGSLMIAAITRRPRGE